MGIYHMHETSVAAIRPAKSAQLVEFFHVVRSQTMNSAQKLTNSNELKNFSFFAVLGKTEIFDRSIFFSPNIMAPPNPFETTFNAPP